MNRSPQYVQMWLLILAFALSESLVLAQPELAKEQAATAQVTEPKIPDIEGVWELVGTEYKRHSVAKVNRNEMIIRRSQDGKSFVLASDLLVIPLTWSSTRNQFEGVHNRNNKVEVKLELTVTSDTTLRTKSEVIHLDNSVPKATSELQYVRIFKTLPPDIAGPWRIVRWDNSAHLFQSIQIDSHDSNWKGTYRDWAKTARGEIELTWSPQSRQFMGTWSEGGHRSGTLTIRLLPDGRTMRGSWTTDVGSRTSDKEPAHSDLEWVRADTDEVKAQASESAGPKPVSEVNKTPDAAAEIKVFTLANGDAADYVKLLRGIFPDVTLQADSRTNQIIAVFKKPEAAPMVEALLLKLDETKTSKAPSRTKGGTDSSRTRSPQELIAAIDGQEHRAVTLAHRIRQLDLKHPDLAKAREELNLALQAALDLKFQQEQLQLQQLEDRLSRLQQQLALRQAAASKIVERRTRELLDGDLQWNPDSPSSQRPYESSNRRIDARPTPDWPLETHTQVKFQEPVGQTWFVTRDNSHVAVPGFYNFERQQRGNILYRIQLRPEPDSEPTVSGFVVIFPITVAQASLRDLASVPLKLTYQHLRQIRLGNRISIVAFVRQVGDKSLLEIIDSTRFDGETTPSAQARKLGTVVAQFTFEDCNRSESARADSGTKGAGHETDWDPKIHINVVESPDVKLDELEKHNLIGSLTGTAAVSISETPSPKGTAPMAVLRDPLGICRQELREQTISLTKLEIEGALSMAGITDIRWEEGPKVAEDDAIPAKHTQIQFTGPVGMRAGFDDSWDPLTIPGSSNFERTDAIRRHNIHLFPYKSKVECVASIDIYPADARVSAFLATNAVPFKMTDDDVQRMKEQKSFLKIAYLQHVGFDGTGQSQLQILDWPLPQANVDPYVEARRRGEIVAVFHFGKPADLPVAEQQEPTPMWVREDLGYIAKRVTGPALVPAPFRGGLQITEINVGPRTNPTGDSLQKGDILIGIGNWETLSLSNVTFAVQQHEKTVSERSSSSKPFPMYVLRNGELVVVRRSYRGRSLSNLAIDPPAVEISLDQWIDLLQRKQASGESIDLTEAIYRIAELGRGSLKSRHQAAMALFIKGETLELENRSDLQLYNEIIQLLKQMPNDELLPLQIEILQSGGPARTLLALHSLKALRDYTTSPEFPALVEQLWKLSQNEDRRRQLAVHYLLADTLALTSLKPEELSTEERHQMVARLIEYVPHQKVIDLHISALRSQEIDLILHAAQVFKKQPEGEQPEIVELRLQSLINIVRGQVGNTKVPRQKRAFALYLMGDLGSKAAPAVPTLIELLQSDDPDVKADEAVPDELGPRRDPPALTSERIVNLLRIIGPDARAALPVLEARLKVAEQREREDALLSPDSRNRQRVATALTLNAAINRIKGIHDR